MTGCRDGVSDNHGKYADVWNDGDDDYEKDNDDDDEHEDDEEGEDDDDDNLAVMVLNRSCPAVSQI